MKREIDKLIANILLDEGSVYLPDVGTLLLIRRPTQLLSSKLVKVPFFELRYTSEKRGASLVWYISCVADVSEERAGDIYNEYVAQSSRDGVFTINNVCVIEGNKVQILQQFEEKVNPNGKATIKVNRRTNYFVYIVAALCMCFALGMAGYVLYTNDVFGLKAKVSPAEDAFKTVSAPESAVAEQSVEVVTEVPTEVAELPAEQSVEPAQSAESAILPLQKGSSYAVWGVYAQLKNAEDAVAWLATKHSDIEAHIYDYDERYMVALCEASSRSECGRKVSKLKAERKGFGNVWVYTR